MCHTVVALVWIYEQLPELSPLKTVRKFIKLILIDTILIILLGSFLICSNNKNVILLLVYWVTTAPIFK